MLIAQMLQDLSYEHHITSRQFVTDGIEDTEFDSRVLAPILRNHKINDITANIPSGIADELTANVEITAAYVDHGRTADFAQKPADCFDIGSDHGGIPASTSGAGAEGKAASPEFFPVDRGKNLAWFLLSETRGGVSGGVQMREQSGQHFARRSPDGV